MIQVDCSFAFLHLDYQVVLYDLGICQLKVLCNHLLLHPSSVNCKAVELENNVIIYDKDL